MKQLSTLLAMLLVILALTPPAHSANGVRIGHFPNITHAQPLVGRDLGIFEKKIGQQIDWKVFNAGPSEMEALIAGHIDIAYVGPNPAVNAFLRSKGKALRIIAGASSGGAALVVPAGSTARTPADFKGKKVASPELGNTQDVALRTWITSAGLRPGRDVTILSIKNPDILMLFQQRKLDGAWVPEPWVTRLVREGGGRVLLDERSLWPEGKFPTTIVVVRQEYLAKNREVVRRFLDAHVEVTELIRKNPDDACRRLNGQLARLMGKSLPPELLRAAFSRLQPTYDPLRAPLLTSAHWAKGLGFLPRQADLARDTAGLFDMTLLNEILKKRALPPVRER